MKFVTTWTFQDGKISESAKKFLATGGPVPEGAVSLGRWHKADLSGGFELIETDDAKTCYAVAAEWADLVDVQTTPVLEDDEVGPILAARFG